MSVVPLRLRYFRRGISFLLSVLSALSFCVTVYLSRYFYRRGILWLLLSVEGFNFLRATWSGIRRPIFNIPQSVASESIGLFVLFPFQLIIALLLSSIPPRPTMPLSAFKVLQISAVSGAILHMAYTAGLVGTAMLTVPAFDPDVWMRDIDSSPSPFPIAILFAYTFPFLARRFEATRPFVQETIVAEVPTTTQCLPTCLPSCAIHDNSANVPRKSLDADAENGVNPPGPPGIKRPPVLPHTLVRIPNAAERRNSIYVDIQVAD